MRAKYFAAMAKAARVRMRHLALDARAAMLDPWDSDDQRVERFLHHIRCAVSARKNANEYEKMAREEDER